MKLTTTKDITLDNDYVDIKYRELTPNIHQIIQLCEGGGSVLLCEKDGATYRVDTDDILYIEWVDNRCCIYTKAEVYFIPTSLKQLEENLPKHFVRVSKMAALNLYKIQSVANSIHFKMNAQMTNGEKIIVGRRYRENLVDAINTLAKEVTI